MTELTTITRPPPLASQPASLPVSNDELVYPHLRLLNRQSRVTLSPTPFQLDAHHRRRLLAVANTRGWFAAVVKKDDALDLVCSPLSDLRTAASAGDDNTFVPSKTISLNAAVPSVLTFAANESRLLLGLVSGEILLYDTSQLFTPATSQVQPVHVLQHLAGASLLQLSANPSSTDLSLASLVAAVLEDGRVFILNTQTFSADGGWAPGGQEPKPVAAAWSPKGKQLAIGLQSGEILAFSLSDKTKPQKIIPSTASLPLVSLRWLAPGHTFHTVYASPDDPQHHIVTLDAATSSSSYVALSYPFPLPDRPQQGFTIFLPNWDFGQGGGSRSLLFFGDVCSTDVEILGHVGSKWDQKSRDDVSIAIPLDKNYEDTFLLGLVVDLTSTTPAPSVLASGESADWPPAPILYAYLNDGTLQAWHITQAAPYVGMITPAVTPPVPSTLDIPNVGDMAPEQEMLTPAQPIESKDQTMQDEKASLVIDSSEMEQTTATPAPAPSTPQTTVSAFGQTGFQSAFGQTSAFSPLAHNTTPVSVFGQGGSTSFGRTPTTSFADTTTPTFGQSAFGFGTTSAVPPVVSKASSNESMPSDDMQAEVTTEEQPKSDPFMSLGGLSLDKPSADTDLSSPAISSVFGPAAFQNVSTPSSGGGLIKPASGFGAFSNLGQSSAPPPTGASGMETPSSLFGSTSKPASAFGQSSFGSPSFGQSSFGKSSFAAPSTFGTSSFGKPSAPTSAVTPSSGGFSSFAQHGTVTFGKPSAPTSTASATPSSGGFASFAQSGSVTFGKPSMQASGTPAAIEVGDAATPAAPTPAASVLSPPPGNVTEDSATPTPSVFGISFNTPSKKVAPPLSSSSSPDSRESSPPAVGGKAASQSVFSVPSQGQSSSIFKPATGFGAFGSSATPTSSPFFNAAKSTSSAAFGSSSSPSAAPVFGSSSFTTAALSGAAESPKFGMSSALGGQQQQSSFGSSSVKPTPTTPSTSSAFAAFSTGPSAFSSFAGPQKSFKDLLSGSGDHSSSEKVADIPTQVTADSPVSRELTEDETQASPPSPDADANAKDTPKSIVDPSATSPEDVSSADTAAVSRPPSVSSKPNDLKTTPPPSDGQSLSSISFSSAASSFVEISNPIEEAGELETTGQDQESDADHDGEDEVDNDDEGSFISEPFSSDASNEDQDDQSVEGEEETGADLSADSASLEDLGLRSPSATPTAELPAVALSKSPTPTPNLPLDADANTTPPGSPDKPTNLSPQLPVTTPSPVFSFGSPAPAPSKGLTAGRPSTRPARSSPLAKTPPLSGEPEQSVEVLEGLHTLEPKPPSSQLKPRPASPKGIFGTLPKPQAIDEDDAGKSNRPKTPPLLLSFGATKASSTTTPTQGPSASPTPPFKMPGSTFSFPSTPPSSDQTTIPSQGAKPTSIFSGLPPAPQPASSSSPFFSPPSQATFAMPTKPLFGGAPSTPFSAPPKSTPVALPSQPPRPTVEEGMQAECVYLFSTLAKELEELKGLARASNKHREDIGQASGIHRKSDLHSPEKWGGLNDVVHFGKTMKSLESDIQQVKRLVNEGHDAIGDLQGTMLRAGTRKEEIARFNKAKNDADFSQMLKSRTLGPEHHETQIQLRKSIRDVRDRVMKLEQHLQASKSKLSRSNKGKPTLKAPSLVTAHRTFKNIDIAIHQQATEIAGLSSRIAKLDISNLRSSTSFGTGSQYGVKRPFNATPNVAATTAAALNAERSTHRLKIRLLAVRKEPLLNNKVAPPTKAPMTFSTPPGVSRTAATTMTPSISFTPSSPGGIEFSPSPSFSPTPTTRRGAAFTSKHYKSVALKKTPSSPEQQQTSTFAPPANFSWGPVPILPPSKPLAAPIFPVKSPGGP